MENQTYIPDEVISNKIFLIRGQKVMLDNDLAELYGVATKRLKEQVNRNASRFPAHYMFKLTKAEHEALRLQDVTLKRGEHSKYLSYAFTEHGILMLSNVLKSELAVKISIQIIDIFVKIRQQMSNHTEIWLAIERIKGKIDNQDKNMEIIFRYLDELSERMPMVQEPGPRKRIGYKPDED